MTTDNRLYRIVFYQDEELYEIYSRSVSEDGLMGFISVEELIFTDPNTTLVIDPNEERLQNEFKGVTRSYIPMHNVLRIDEVETHGVARIKESGKPSNVSAFPTRRIESKPHD